MTGKRAVLVLIIIVIAIVAFNANFNFNVNTQTGGSVQPIVILDTRSTQNDNHAAITQLLSNQQQLLKIALNRKPTPKPMPTPKSTNGSVFKDWAPLSKATQSSTYKSMSASNAIDGKADTFSHTDVKPDKNSWLKVTLPTSVEISKIVIENRKDTPGSFQFRKRLPPFTVTIKNASGVVTASKVFTNVLQTYTWSDIFVVGSQIIIEQQKKNYLHVADIKVYGIAAQDCSYYEKMLALHRSTASNLLLKLKESACMLGLTTEAQKETRKVLASKFDAILKKQTKTQQKQMKQAQALLKQVENQQLKERQLAAQAKRLGLAPPPAMYTKAQVEKLQGALNPVEKQLSETDKAECMTIHERLQTLSQQASDLASKMGDEGTPTAQMEIIANEIKQLQNRYTEKCTVAPITADLEEFGATIDEEAPALS
jgi:hypothetical protein